MTTIVTRAGKGSPLTHTEVDTNFTNLNTAKLEAGAIALGSAATPSISFTGDTNTGIYSPGADQVAISTNGTGRLFVDASGNVGVGASSPANGRLNVSSTTNQITLDTTDTATYGRLDIGYFANGTFIGTYAGSNTASDLIRLGTNGTERLRIDSSGRLLVGTSSSIESTSRLQVKDGSLNIYHASAAAGAGYAILFTTDGSSSALAQAKIEGLQETANTSGGRLVFSTSASGSGSPTERMRIPNGGGLCVGSTVNPNALTQTSGIRLGTSTIASHDFTNITTSPVTIANGVGIGGLAFVQAYNTSTGAQYTGIIMWRSGVVAVVSESNALGFNLTYTVSGSTLLLQTASGTISGGVITFAS